MISEYGLARCFHRTYHHYFLLRLFTVNDESALIMCKMLFCLLNTHPRHMWMVATTVFITNLYPCWFFSERDNIKVMRTCVMENDVYVHSLAIVIRAIVTHFSL